MTLSVIGHNPPDKPPPQITTPWPWGGGLCPPIDIIGWVICPVKSSSLEMTYNVSNGTLNPIILILNDVALRPARLVQDGRPRMQLATEIKSAWPSMHG